MRNYLFYLAILSVLILTSCTSEKEFSMADISLIPKPQDLKLHRGSFKLNEITTWHVESEFKIASDFLQNYLKNGAGIVLKNVPKSEANIIFKLDDSLPKEAYSLSISKENIIIKASDGGGAFYAVQSLRQLMPPQLEQSNTIFRKSIILPQITLFDAPAFRYRGMHLDVSRHFFSKEFIKQYISNMAMLKMNYFHWHLTDDQGWRIEIKKYPKLNSHAAFRNETLVGHYNETPQQFDGKRYGGYYTQEDIKEIVAFAAKNNVTIIPEIEMPGHSQAAISAYPELGCLREEVAVATKWGVFENIYCPTENTFTFLQDVLTEIMALFPGEYVHIGGDEAPKLQWEHCKHCQKLIKELNLKDENGLQSYFIKRIETFVNSKGKKIIGWDEILEGGLAPNATVMSWRGTQSAIDAAKEGHDVILTPNSHAYFDYYQSENQTEPLAIGGFIPLKKVYGFNPVPKELNEKETQFVLGAQGNVWTEYIETESQVEYMVFPRILAMSEVIWRGVTENIEVDYKDFVSRLESFMARMDALHINYANHLYEIEGKIQKKDGNVFYTLTTPTEGKEIRYSINDSAFKKNTTPIPIRSNCIIKANVFKNDKKVGENFTEEILYHKGLNAKVSINIPPHPAYGAGGVEALINGINGSDSRYGDKEWLGFWGDDVEITIDFGEELQLKQITTRYYNAPGQWIYAPKFIEVEDEKGLVSSAKISGLEESIKNVKIMLGIKTRYLKIRVPSYGVIPAGLQGAGNKAWTFIDEIIIE
jgi:hexosaminidase